MDPWSLIAEDVRSHILSHHRARPLPWSEIEDGFVAIIDISGFTTLTSHVAERWGAAGGGAMREILSEPFRRILDRVHIHHGTAVKLAGDAAIVSWRGSSLTTAHSAVTCCIELLHQFKNYDINLEAYKSARASLVRDMTKKAEAAVHHRLQIHIGLSFGPIHHCFIGEAYKPTANRSFSGYYPRSEYFIGGPTLEEAGILLGQGGPGDLVCSQQCTKVVEELELRKEFERTSSGSLILSSALIPSELPWSVLPSASNLCERTPNHQRFTRDHVLHALCFVEESISALCRERVGEDGTLTSLEEEDLNQTRQITTVFIKVERPSVRMIGEGHNLLLAQSIFVRCLSQMRQYGGCLRQFNCDDKSATILMVWGMKGFARERGEEVIALKAALAIERTMKELVGNDFSIGVTTGNVFTGVIGSMERSDGTVLGTSVNLAARLMCHELANGRIVCDLETYSASTSDATLNFEILPAVLFKGMSAPAKIFSPRITANTLGDGMEDTHEEVYIAGRREEIEMLEAAFEAWSIDPGSVPGRITIVGASGMGKSALGSHLLQLASKKHNILICKGAGNENLQFAMFYAYSQILTSLVDGLIKSGYTAEMISQILIVVPPDKSISAIPNNTSQIVNGASPNQSSINDRPYRESGTSDVNIADFMTKLSRFRRHNPTRANARAKVHPQQVSQSSSVESPSPFAQESLKEVDSAQISDPKITNMINIMVALKEDHINVLWALSALSLLPKNKVFDVEGDDKTGRLSQLLFRLITNTSKLGIEVLLHIDNLQWMDISSIELTRELFRLCPRVFFLILSRPISEFKDYLIKKTRGLMESMNMRVLHLTDLSIEEIKLMVLRVQPHLSSNEARLKTLCRDIFERSGGNPLVAQILLSLVSESERNPDGSNQVTVPRDIFSAIQAQLDQLEPEFKSIVRVAAVAGQSFDIGEVAYVVNKLHKGSGLPADVSDIIARGDKFHFIKSVRRSDDSVGFEFAHCLLNQGILQSMLDQRLDDLHFHFFQYYEERVLSDINAKDLRALMRHLTNINGHLGLKIKYSFQIFTLSASMLQTVEAFIDHKLYRDFLSEAGVTRSVLDTCTEMHHLANLAFQASRPEEALRYCLDALSAVGYSFPSSLKEPLRFTMDILSLLPKTIRVSMMTDDREWQIKFCEKTLRQKFKLAYAMTIESKELSQIKMVMHRVLGTLIMLLHDGVNLGHDILLVAILEVLVALSISELDSLSIALSLARQACVCAVIYMPHTAVRLTETALNLSKPFAEMLPSMNPYLVWTNQNFMASVMAMYGLFADWTHCEEFERKELECCKFHGRALTNMARRTVLLMITYWHLTGTFDPAISSFSYQIMNSSDSYLKRHVFMNLASLNIMIGDNEAAEFWYSEYRNVIEPENVAYQIFIQNSLALNLILYHTFKLSDQTKESLDVIALSMRDIVAIWTNQTAFERCSTLHQIFRSIPLTLAYCTNVLYSNPLAQDINAVWAPAEQLFATVARECNHSNDSAQLRPAFRFLRDLARGALSLRSDPFSFCKNIRVSLRRAKGRVFWTDFYERQMLARVLTVALRSRCMEDRRDELLREARDLVEYFEGCAIWEARQLKAAMC